MRKHVQEAAAKKDVKQLIEHFRKELTGSKDILIAEDYEKSLEKTKTRMPSEKQHSAQIYARISEHGLI